VNIISGYKEGRVSHVARPPAVLAELDILEFWPVEKVTVPANCVVSNGSLTPFAKTKIEQLAASDLRLSLEDRCGYHAEFVAAVRQAAMSFIAACSC
jgi:hypothetical protein